MFLSNSNSDSASSSSSEEDPVSSTSSKTSENIKLQEVEQQLKNLTNSISKEEIRDLTGKMGEVINQNLKKIVPQKGVVKGPYGRPLVYNPSNMPSGG